jgi:hypothetical protein
MNNSFFPWGYNPIRPGYAQSNNGTTREEQLNSYSRLQGQSLSAPSLQVTSAHDDKVSFFSSGIKAFLAHITEGKQNQVLYYPACGTHACKSSELPSSITKVVYLDPDQNSIETLRRAGLENLYQESAKDFTLEDKDSFADIVLLNNHYGFNLKDIYKQIKPGGLVITSNGWNQDASQIYLEQIPGLKLKEVLSFSEGRVVSIPGNKITWEPGLEANRISLTAKVQDSDASINSDELFFVFEKANSEYQEPISYSDNSSSANMMPNLLYFATHSNPTLESLYASSRGDARLKQDTQRNEFILTEDEVNHLYNNIPPSIRNLSDCNLVDFSYAKKIFVPKYNSEGSLGSGAELRTLEEFPMGSDHPSKFYVGLYSSPKIFMSGIPPQIESIQFDAKVRKNYQAYVFLHEFFHSVINKYIDNPTTVDSVSFQGTDGRTFTLDDWLREAREILKQDSRPFTNYLKIYEANIKNNEAKDSYNLALKEYLCEAFALYMGVNLPNPNETDDTRPELVKHIEKLTKSVTPMHN